MFSIRSQAAWSGVGAAFASLRPIPSLSRVLRSCTSASEPSDAEIKDMAPYDKIDWVQTMIVHKKGHDVLADPIFNKGTAFSTTERERLGIRGLLPPKVSNLTEQKKNVLTDYHKGLDYVSPEDLEHWSISRCAISLGDACELLYMFIRGRLPWCFYSDCLDGELHLRYDDIAHFGRDCEQGPPDIQDAIDRTCEILPFKHHEYS
jgi:hypothetical protein